MDKRKTSNSIYARQIYDELLSLPHPVMKSWVLPDPLSVRNRTRHLLWEAGVGHEYNMKIVGSTLFVATRQYSREQQLTDIVRKLLLHCDDEYLYEQAFRLVEVK